MRVLPRKPTRWWWGGYSVLISDKLRKNVRARRMFVRPAQIISLGAPIDASPATTVEKKNPDRTISAGRRVIAYIRRTNIGFAPPHYYYPVRAPSLEAMGRLLVSATLSFPWMTVGGTMRDIASAFRLLRLRPSRSLVMRTELPGAHFNFAFYFALFYLVRPIGRYGSPGNSAIFGGAISAIHSRSGKGRPGWFSAPLSVEAICRWRIVFELRYQTRQNANTTAGESIADGLVGRKFIHNEKLEEQGAWRPTHTTLGFDIDASALTIPLPVAQVAGARALLGQMQEKSYTRALDANTPQQVLGRNEHIRISNSMRRQATGPVDPRLRYADECSIWVSFQTSESR